MTYKLICAPNASNHKMKRKILDFSMGHDGPLIIVFAAMHGNEMAGVLALQRLGLLLKAEQNEDPNFRFEGHIVGYLGNISAYQAQKRYIDADLNRLWGDTLPHPFPLNEIRQLRAIKKLINTQIAQNNHTDVVILDLHTTSADGGIFSIALDGKLEQKITTALLAPTVKGLLHGISGTLLHYIKELTFPQKRIAGVAFEAGQHDDPNSIDRAVAGMILTLRVLQCIDPQCIEQKHTDLLKTYSEGLPKSVTLVYAHKIAPNSGFVMRPGYRNFEAIAHGEHLADDIHGPIRSTINGILLMPLYQKQGSDGFFVCRED
jgi:succinylglutamate desuccinylase